MIALECRKCRTSPTSEALLAYACAVCGAPLSTRLPQVVFTELIDRDRGPVWRYQALLPAPLRDELDDAVPVNVQRSRELERALRVAEAWVIDGTTLGTGTFKDYEASVVAAMAKDLGLSRISVHSTGNTALAYRHYAERLKLSCAAYVPLRNAAKMGDARSSPDFPIVGIDAEYAAVSQKAKAHAAATDRTHLAPMPWKLEGKAALAWAIYEHCPQVDTIVQTVAGGYGPLGMEIGFDRLTALGEANGVLARRRYRLCQPADASSLARAWHLPNTRLDLADLDLPTHPYEPTLQSTNPIATLPALRARMPSGTTIDPVTPSQVDEAMKLVIRICAELEIPLDIEREKSACIAIAGMVATTWEPGTAVAVILSGSRPFATPIVGSSDWEHLTTVA